MTLQIADRIWDVTNTTGTGTISLSNAPPIGYSTFGSVCNDGDTVYYVLSGRTANVWEVNLGTYHAAGPTLTRNPVASSAGGGLVSLAGITDVLAVWPAAKLIQVNNINVKSFGATGNTQISNNTASIGSGSHNLTVTTGVFAASDVGKTIFVPQAGTAGADLVTTISAFTSSTAVTLTAAAGTAVTSLNCPIVWGTDDTTAITNAIAALPTTGGRLYFPCGTYLAPNGGFTIANGSMIEGDGMPSTSDDVLHSSTPASIVVCTSPTAVLFTITPQNCMVRDIGVFNPSTVVTAGAGFVANGPLASACVNWQKVAAVGFWINYDIQVGAEWTMFGCKSGAAGLYGTRIQNTINNDEGDWVVSCCAFSADEGLRFPYITRACTAAIYQLSSGGGRIVSNKFNQGAGNLGFMLHGIWEASVSSSELTIEGNNFDQVLYPILLEHTLAPGVGGEIAIVGNNPVLGSGTSNTSSSSISGTTLTVSTLFTQSGAVCVGDVVLGGGTLPDTIVLNQLTGVAGMTGTYTVSKSQSVGAASLNMQHAQVGVLASLPHFIIAGNQFAGSTNPFYFAPNITISNGVIGPNTTIVPGTQTYVYSGLIANSRGITVTNVQDISSFQPPLGNWFVGPLDPRLPGYANAAFGSATYSGVPANASVVASFQVAVPTLVSNVAFSIGVQSGNLCLGIYDSLGNLLATTGSFACPAAGAARQGITNNTLLLPGQFYYAAFGADNTTVTFLSAPGYSLTFFTGNSNMNPGYLTSNFPLVSKTASFPVGNSIIGTPVMTFT